MSGVKNLIYEQFVPQDTSQAREYELYLLSKKIQKDPSLHSYLGTGQIENMSNGLSNYLKDQRLERTQVQTKYGKGCLQFDSTFECGNLMRAEYISPCKYRLFIQSDSNTRGHQQWFYFKARRLQSQLKYQFTIMNCTKPYCLYRSGMRIWGKSKKGGSIWKLMGDNIEYNKTDEERVSWGKAPKHYNDDEVESKKKRYLYSLSFEFTSEHNNDSMYFAYCLPYSYSQFYSTIIEKEQLLPSQTNLQKDWIINKQPELILFKQSSVLTQPQWPFISHQSMIYEHAFIGKSMSGLPISVIQITGPINPKKCTQQFIPLYKRQAIVITARVHPGECNSSHVFQGALDFLLSDLPGAQFLRAHYILILVPFLNPDGVILGNYRSSLSGLDLNRQWINPDIEIKPEIHAVKNFLSQISKTRGIVVFCDLHGHARKKNTFIYGCNIASNGGFLSWTKVRLLPRIFAKKSYLFSYKKCKFRVDGHKLGTARVVVWKDFQVTNSFTLETSFHGYKYGGGATTEFTKQIFEEIGNTLCKTIVRYHYLSKQVERDTILTQGWLKPRMLFDITGIPAEQEIFEEMEKKRQLEQKRLRIEEYKRLLFGPTGPPLLKRSVILMKKGEEQHSKQTKVVIKRINEPEPEDVQEDRQWLEYFDQEEIQEALDHLQKDNEMFERHIKNDLDGDSDSDHSSDEDYDEKELAQNIYFGNANEEDYEEIIQLRKKILRLIKTNQKEAAIYLKQLQDLIDNKGAKKISPQCVAKKERKRIEKPLVVVEIPAIINEIQIERMRKQIEKMKSDPKSNTALIALQQQTLNRFEQTNQQKNLKGLVMQKPPAPPSMKPSSMPRRIPHTKLHKVSTERMGSELMSEIIRSSAMSRTFHKHSVSDSRYKYIRQLYQSRRQECIHERSLLKIQNMDRSQKSIRSNYQSIEYKDSNQTKYSPYHSIPLQNQVALAAALQVDSRLGSPNISNSQSGIRKNVNSREDNLRANTSMETQYYQTMRLLQENQLVIDQKPIKMNEIIANNIFIANNSRQSDYNKRSKQFPNQMQEDNKSFDMHHMDNTMEISSNDLDGLFINRKKTPDTRIKKCAPIIGKSKERTKNQLTKGAFRSYTDPNKNFKAIGKSYYRKDKRNLNGTYNLQNIQFDMGSSVESAK